MKIVETTNVELSLKSKVKKKKKYLFLRSHLQRVVDCDAEISRLTLSDLAHHTMLSSDGGDTILGTERRASTTT